MTNKPNVNVCSALNGVNIINKQKQLECSIFAPNSKTILAVSSTPVLEKCEGEGKFIKVEGLVYTKVLYEDVDGTNCVVDNKCSFADVIDVGDVATEFSCLGNVVLSDLDFKTSSTDEIKANFVLNFEICVFCENETQYVECDSEGLYTLPTEVQISTLLDANSENFAESFEVELGGNVARVLDCSASATVKDVAVSGSQIIVDGIIVNNIVFESLDDNHTLASKTATYDFKQTFEIANAEDGAKAFANVSIMSDKLQVVCEDVEGSMLAHIDYPMTAQYIVVGTKTITSLTDAYSTTNEISITNTSQGVLNIVGNVNKTEKIDTNVTIEKDSQTIEKVYSYNINNIDLTKKLIDGDVLLVEGIAYCNIIFQSYDRETELSGNTSIVAEIPFSTKIGLSGLKVDDIIIAKASPVSVDVRIKRSQELDIIAEIELNINAVRNLTTTLVSDIEIGEEKPASTSALSLYLVQKGKTYWDIAKQLSVNVDELELQNEDVILPSEKTEKVVYFRQLQKQC